jgi:invasion protein IalB
LTFGAKWRVLCAESFPFGVFVTKMNFFRGRLLAAFLASVLTTHVAVAQKATPPAPAATVPSAAAPGTPNVVELKPEPSQPNWVKVCGKDQAANKEICYTTRDFVSEQNTPVLAAAVYDIKGEKEKIVRFLLPLALLLERGIRVSVDQEKPVNGSFAICFPNGCFAEVKVSDAFIASMKKGKRVQISVQNAGAAEVSFRAPLDKFGEGFDGAAIDPKVLEEQQKNLQQELERRSDEIRKRMEQQKPAETAPKP